MPEGRKGDELWRRRRRRLGLCESRPLGFVPRPSRLYLYPDRTMSRVSAQKSNRSCVALAHLKCTCRWVSWREDRRKRDQRPPVAVGRALPQAEAANPRVAVGGWWNGSISCRVRRGPSVQPLDRDAFFLLRVRAMEAC
jgi:hypothetical protein